MSLAGGGTETAELVVRVRFKIEQSELARMQAAVKELGGRITSIGKDAGLQWTKAAQQIGRGFKDVGTGFFKAIERGALLGGLALTYLAKKSLDFEDAFAGVRRTLSDNTTPQMLAKIREGLLALSRTLPITQQDLAQMAEVAGTTGVAAEDIVKFTEAVARLAKVTDLSISEVTPAIGQLMLQLHLGADELNNFFSGLSKASIIGPSTDQAILLAVSRFSALGTQIGFTRDELLALSTVATSFGQRPEAAGTAVLLVMQRLTRDIAEGGKALKLLAKTSGQTVAQVRDQWQTNPMQGLIDFLEGINKLPAGQQAIVLKGLGLSTARIGQLIANLAANIPTLQRYTAEITKADKEGKLFLELSDARFTTTRNHIAVLMNNIRDMGIAFGEGLGIDTATGALDRFISRLIAFIKSQRGFFVELGRDVGRFLDSLDESKIKTFLNTVKDIGTVIFNSLKLAVDILNRLPPDLRNLLIVAGTLNKLSGGLIGTGLGGIIGGLLSPITSAVGAAFKLALVEAGLGKLFVQPVLVMNQGFGTGAELAGAVGASLTVVLGALAGLIVSQIGKLFPPPPTGNRAADILGLGPGSPFSFLIPNLPRPPINTGGHPFGSDLAALANLFRPSVLSAGKIEDDLALMTSETQKQTRILQAQLEALKPLHPRHLGRERGRSLQGAEHLELRRLQLSDPLFLGKLTRDVDELVKHYMTERHPRAFVVPRVGGTERHLGQLLRQALASNNPDAAFALAQKLRKLDKVVDLPPKLERLVNQTIRGHGKIEETNRRVSAVRAAVHHASDELAGLRETLKAKKLAVGLRTTVHGGKVSVGPTFVRVTVGTRSIFRATQRTVAYGPTSVYQNPGDLWAGHGGP